MASLRKVVAIGLDGLDPNIVEQMIQAGELANLARLRVQGGYTRLATTTPAQTPVAWSTFATGVNPGGHGIYDFLRRNPLTYLPDLALVVFYQSRALLPPKAVNLRRGQPLWDLLGKAGIPSVVLRCPCTFPAEEIEGALLSGMGAPDIRGGLGTATIYTTQHGAAPGEAEQLVQLTGESPFHTVVIGPRNPRDRTDVSADITVEMDHGNQSVVVRSGGEPTTLSLRVGERSDWMRLRFRAGPLSTTHGMVRFTLLKTSPHLELYASPVNWDPASPPFPISTPWDYAGALARDIGLFHTTGMVEDHGALSNGRVDESFFLRQCEELMRERERMLQHELARLREGFLFCLFDTPDRLQHMFWRFREPSHPANAGADTRLHARAIEEHYTRCDEMVGRVIDAIDENTLLIVLSDHGFTSFQRGVNVNRWLAQQGLLAFHTGTDSESSGEFFRNVDWGNTQAYAIGLGSVYLNVRGREGEGTVDPLEADALSARIAQRLHGLVDEERGAVAVRSAKTRRDLYAGPFVDDAPDIVLQCAPGYRASWSTALGGAPRLLFEDNVRKWGGDHIVDPELVPGVLFMNRSFNGQNARMVDLAPTILTALGVNPGRQMEGVSLWS